MIFSDASIILDYAVVPESREEPAERSAFQARASLPGRERPIRAFHKRMNDCIYHQEPPATCDRQLADIQCM